MIESDERLETVVREYRRARDYERDVRHRRREGWRVVSVLQRPGQPSTVRRVAIGSGLARPETEYLVTYHRVAQPAPRARPLEWLMHPHMPRVPRVAQLRQLPRLPHSRTSAWIWLAIALVLVALLTYGFADFFADSVPF